MVPNGALGYKLSGGQGVGGGGEGGGGWEGMSSVYVLPAVCLKKLYHAFVYP